MALKAANVFRLGIKELYGLKADPVLMIMIVYVFSFAVYAASGVKFEVEHAAVGVVDEDRSELSRRIAGALLPPYFKPAVEIGANEIDPNMNSGRLLFVLEIPPKFEQDVLAGRLPTVQINVDATTMTQAGNGATYLANIVAQEAISYAGHGSGELTEPVNLVIRTRFNPNLRTEWFNATMVAVINITLMGVVLAGSALLREREHGTVEHLLVMPVRPAEIMMAKIWANGLVIVVTAVLSLLLVVHGLIGMPLAGSMPLFIIGATLYVISVGALGILLATFTGSMGQFGLLVIPTIIILSLLSGTMTPEESMPVWLRDIMAFTPTPHFVRFVLGVLFRGAGLDIVWPQLLVLAGFTVAYVVVSLGRFRAFIARS